MIDTELIIFDLDGTLVDSREDISNAVNFTLRELGLKEKKGSEISSYIGNGVQDLVEKSLEMKNNHLLEKALLIFEQYYRKHAADASYLYPSVKEVLEYFKNKRKAVATNRNYEFAAITMKELGIYDYFEGVFGGDDLWCKKPSSCPFDKVIDLFKIADRKKTIMVGDMDIDVLAGKGAGVFTCAVTYGIGKKEDIVKAKPDYIIDDLAQLKNIVK